MNKSNNYNNDSNYNNCDVCDDYAILNFIQEANTSGCYSFYDSMLLALILSEQS